MIKTSTLVQPVILFDGVCNLCSSAVQFVLKRDKQQLFTFASLQSAFGQGLLKESNVSPTDFNSFILFTRGKIYTRSLAALLVAKQLSGGWPLLYFFILVPAFIRNGIYNFIAKNRYKWFGKKDHCWIPSADLSTRFLD